MTFTDGSRKSDDVSHWKLRDYPPSKRSSSSNDAPPPPPTQVYLSLEDPFHPRVTAVATPIGQAYRIQSVSPAFGGSMSRPLLFSGPSRAQDASTDPQHFASRRTSLETQSRTQQQDSFNLPQPGDQATSSLRGGLHSVSSLAMTPVEESTMGQFQSAAQNSSFPTDTSSFHSIVRDNGQKKLDHWRRHREMSRRSSAGPNVLASSAARRSWAEDGAAFPQSFPSRSTSVLSVVSATDDADVLRQDKRVKAEWRNPVDSFASQTDFPDTEDTASDPKPSVRASTHRREDFFDTFVPLPKKTLSANVARDGAAAPQEMTPRQVVSMSRVSSKSAPAVEVEAADDPVIPLNSVIARPTAPVVSRWPLSSTESFVSGANVLSAIHPSEEVTTTQISVASDPVVAEFLTNVRQQQEDLLKIVLHQQEHISRLEEQRSGDQPVQQSTVAVETLKVGIANHPEFSVQNRGTSPIAKDEQARRSSLTMSEARIGDGLKADKGNISVRGIQFEVKKVSQTETSTQCIQPASDSVDDIERELRRLDDETTAVLRHKASYETSQSKQHDEIRQKLSRHFALKQQHHQLGSRSEFAAPPRVVSFAPPVEPSRIDNSYVFSNTMTPLFSRAEKTLAESSLHQRVVHPQSTYVDSSVQHQSRDVVAAQTNTEQIPKIAQSTMTSGNQPKHSFDRSCQYDEVPPLPPKSDAMELFLQLKQQYLSLRKKNDICVPMDVMHSKPENWTRI